MLQRLHFGDCAAQVAANTNDALIELATRVGQRKAPRVAVQEAHPESSSRGCTRRVMALIDMPWAALREASCLDDVDEGLDASELVHGPGPLPFFSGGGPARERRGFCHEITEDGRDVLSANDARPQQPGCVAAPPGKPTEGRPGGDLPFFSPEPTFRRCPAMVLCPKQLSMAYDGCSRRDRRSGSSAASRPASPTATIRLAHALPTLVGQRVFAIALGYEDLVDHGYLRRDPRRRRASDGSRPSPGLAGKSRLNRLEDAGGCIAIAMHRP